MTQYSDVVDVPNMPNDVANMFDDESAQPDNME